MWPYTQIYVKGMHYVLDNSHYRLDLDNKNEIPGTNLLKVVKYQNVVETCCNVQTGTWDLCVFL